MLTADPKATPVVAEMGVEVTSATFEHVFETLTVHLPSDSPSRPDPGG